MDLAEFRCAPYGRALKRFRNKGAKPGCKRKFQFYYKTEKSLKNLLTIDTIKPKKRKRDKSHRIDQKFDF